MNCSDLEDRLDDYIDGELDTAAHVKLDAHLADCARCRLRVARERELRSLLVNYGDSATELPGEDWFDAALERAAAVGTQRRRSRWLAAAAGGMLAASLALWLGSGVRVVPESTSLELPAVTMTLAEPHTVRLLFSATAPLAGARLTLELPDGLEVAGFPGRQRLAWRTSLTAGDNLLPLELVASTPAGGELVARLEHAGEAREFRLRIAVAATGG